MSVSQLFAMHSVRNRIVELKARCWLLFLHRLATREEERRLGRGRLSMISSIISWGSESIAGVGGKRQCQSWSSRAPNDDVGDKFTHQATAIKLTPNHPLHRSTTIPALTSRLWEHLLASPYQHPVFRFLYSVVFRHARMLVEVPPDSGPPIFFSGL